MPRIIFELATNKIWSPERMVRFRIFYAIYIV